ncbi:TonB-dependent receptor [Parasalinivibrio latis]|uniref:TonB-dependent receptor domain-containing protein n=1 Tax=Parasalinivibrio latis TaxID=2952610 RepID=UPI0030E332EF
MNNLSPFRGTPTVVAASVSLALASGMAFAETAENKDVETMVVSGSLMQGPDVIIDSTDLDRQQAVDLSDIFASDPEVAVGGGFGPIQKAYIRGLEDTFMNVTIDGAAQAGYMFHHQGRLMIEPELLKQVEVAAGAGEATNGPGALGGSIRFETKDPEDLLYGDQKIGGLVKGGYYSNTQGYKTSGTVFGQLNENVSAMATVLKADYDDYKDGDGTKQPHTESGHKVGFLKVVGDFAESHKVSLSYENRKEEGVRAHKPNIQDTKGRIWPQENERQTFTAKYGFNPVTSELVDLELTAYNTENVLFHDSPTWEPFSGKVISYGLDLRNTSTLGIHELEYGMDYSHDTSRLDQDAVTEVDVKETGTIHGIYLQDRISVTEQLLLSIGLRYDRYETEQSSDNTKPSFTLKDDGWSPNAGFRFLATDNIEVHGGWAQAFRGPRVRETFTLFRAPEKRVGEEAENYELGVIYRLDGFQFAVKGYRTTIDNAVGNGVSNLGKLETEGFIARVGYVVDKLDASLSYSKSSPELNGDPLNDDSLGLGVDVGDSWFAKVNYAYSDQLDFGWTGEFVQRLDKKVNDGTTYAAKPGYGVHNLYAQYLPLQSEDLTLTLTVNNLLDKQYTDHASYSTGFRGDGIPNPGRDIRVNLAYAF